MTREVAMTEDEALALVGWRLISDLESIAAGKGRSANAELRQAAMLVLPLFQQARGDTVAMVRLRQRVERTKEQRRVQRLADALEQHRKTPVPVKESRWEQQQRVKRAQSQHPDRVAERQRAKEVRLARQRDWEQEARRKATTPVKGAKVDGPGQRHHPQRAPGVQAKSVPAPPSASQQANQPDVRPAIAQAHQGNSPAGAAKQRQREEAARRQAQQGIEQHREDLRRRQPDLWAMQTSIDETRKAIQMVEYTIAVNRNLLLDLNSESITYHERMNAILTDTATLETLRAALRDLEARAQRLRGA
jgi:hypothetical protein